MGSLMGNAIVNTQTTGAYTTGISNFASMSTQYSKTMMIGNIFIDGEAGTITYKAENGERLVMNLENAHKIRAIMDELKESHPDALFTLIMKGLI